jgi:hypothetical protein
VKQSQPVEPSELYLHIFSELKKEIAEAVKDGRATERNTLLACGALCAFIFERGSSVGSLYLNFVPLALALFGAVRVVALMISIRPRAQYLRRLEDLTLQDPPLAGWEVFFRSHYRWGVGLTEFVFWIVLIAAMSVIPIVAPEATRVAH